MSSESFLSHAYVSYYMDATQGNVLLQWNA